MGIRKNQGLTKSAYPDREIRVPEWTDCQDFLDAVRRAVALTGDLHQVRVILRLATDQDERVRIHIKALLGDLSDYQLCSALQELLSSRVNIKGLQVRIDQKRICLTYIAYKQ